MNLDSHVLYLSSSDATAMQDFVRETLGAEPDFRKRLKVPAGWVVVPTMSGGHFDLGSCDNISRASVAAGAPTLIGILIEEATNVPKRFRLPATRDALRAFSHELGFMEYALVAENKQLVVICSMADFYLVAGEPRTVEIALGSTIDEARREFRDYAVSMRAHHEEHGHLLRLSDLYDDQ